MKALIITLIVILTALITPLVFASSDYINDENYAALYITLPIIMFGTVAIASMLYALNAMAKSAKLAAVYAKLVAVKN